MSDDELPIGDDDTDHKGDAPTTPHRRTGSAGSTGSAAPKSPVNAGGGGGSAAGTGPQSPVAAAGNDKKQSGGGAAGASGPPRSAVTGQPLNADLITLKVALVGPKQSGKTLLANHLSGFGDPKPGDAERYEPTIGVRVLEFERAITARSRDGKQSMETRVCVELWDTSGDAKFEGCWPAVTQDVHGVVVVFDPKSKQHTAELKAWTEWFARAADLDSNQCVLWAHGTLATQHPNFGPIKTPKRTLSIPVVNVNTVVPGGAAAAGAAGAKPSSSGLAFTQFLGDVFAYHKLADFA